LEKIPPEVRSEVKGLFSTISARFIGPPPHPFADKLTKEHITKIIDNVEQDEQRQFQEGRDIRRMGMTIFFAMLVPVTGLIVFFTLLNKADLLVGLISALVGFGGGFGGGYGFGKYRRH